MKTIILALTALTTMCLSLNGQNSFEFLKTDKSATTRVRPNLYYNLPLNVKGYSYVEIYADGKNYYGETYLTKDVIGPIGIQGQVDFANTFNDYGGLGIIATIPLKDTTTLLTFSFMPFFHEFQGQRLKEFMLLEFVFYKEFKVTIVGTFRINTFGQMNMIASGGPQWYYGEAYLEKPFGKHFFLGAGLDLFTNDKWYPDAVPAFKLGYTF